MKKYLISLSVMTLFLGACQTTQPVNSMPVQEPMAGEVVAEPIVAGSIMIKPDMDTSSAMPSDSTSRVEDKSCEEDPNQEKCLQSGGAGGVILRNNTNATDVDCVTDPLQDKCTQSGGAGGVILRDNQ